MKKLLCIAIFTFAEVALCGTIPPFTPSPFIFSGTPNSVTLGSDGNIWLIDRAANKVGRLTPAGVYTTFGIPTASAIASGITLGPDGNAWFAEFGPSPNKIGRVTPDGVITEFPLSTGKSLGSIAAGPDGNVWFIESQSSPNGPVYFLAHVSTADGTIGDFALPTTGRAQSLVTGADGNLWIGWVEFSGSKYDVLRVTPSGTATTFPLPSTSALNALGATMLLGPDHNIWFTFQNNLTRVTTDGGVTLYAIPTANSNMLPAGLSIGKDGNIWFTEFSSGKIGQLIVTSATDNGQATINESDSLGGLPQTMFLLPSAPRAAAKTGALEDTRCGDQNDFVIEHQSTSNSPAELVVLRSPLAQRCADISVIFEVHFLYPYERAFLGISEGGRVPTAFVQNNGPSDATNVELLLNWYAESSGLKIDRVVPAKPTLDQPVPVADGQCDPIQRGAAGVAFILKCRWPSLELHGQRRVYLIPATGTKDYRSRWEAGASAAEPEPSEETLKNNFDIARFDSSGNTVERIAIEPIIRGTVSVTKRGH